jgi:two-component system sensor histidine kinase AlgZ
MDIRRPLDTFWTTTGLAWTLIGGEALALVLALAPGITGDRLVWFGLNSLVIQWISLSTLGLLYLAREALARLSPNRLAVVGLVTLLLGTWLTTGALWLAFSSPLHLRSGSWPELLLQSTSLALVVGLLAIAALQNHLRLQRLAVQATRAQLQALQARIRPHFLFNTLNSAVSLARTEPARTEALLMDMADLFRMALSPTTQIPLAEEITLCRRYLAIEQARFGARLQVQWQLAEPLPAVMVPPLCLQPLLENAVHHGVERSLQPSLLQISVRVDGPGIAVEVRNPIPGGGTPTHQGHGVGLESVRARLANHSGHASLQTLEQDGQHVARLLFTASDQVTTR